MRTRGLMRIDGNLIATWVDHGPGYARTGRHSGEMVSGISEAEGDRIAQRKRDERDKLAKDAA